MNHKKFTNYQTIKIKSIIKKVRNSKDKTCFKTNYKDEDDIRVEFDQHNIEIKQIIPTSKTINGLTYLLVMKKMVLTHKNARIDDSKPFYEERYSLKKESDIFNGSEIIHGIESFFYMKDSQGNLYMKIEHYNKNELQGRFYLKCIKPIDFFPKGHFKPHEYTKYCSVFYSDFNDQPACTIFDHALKKIVQEHRDLFGKYHRNGDLPAYIVTNMNGIAEEKIYAWHGYHFRSGNRPTFEKYDMNGEKMTFYTFHCKCMYGKESTLTVEKVLYPARKAEDCFICLDKEENINKLRRTSCDHVAHFNCLKYWIEKNRTCPVCRAVLLMK